MRHEKWSSYMKTFTLGLLTLPLLVPAAAAQDFRVFATSTAYDGALGGLAGGDAKCQAHADGASLGGTWVAWLSTSSVDAKDRLVEPAGVFVRAVDGTQVADDIADLIDGSIDATIARTELDGAPPSIDVWTGTRSNGTEQAAKCSDWSVATGNGFRGRTNLSDGRWTEENIDNCVNLLTLYCFEVAGPPAAVPAADWRGMALLVVLMLAGTIYLRRRYRSA